MYIYFSTFGCKVNVYETAGMAERFRQAGFDITTDRNAADIYIINSCTVTAESDSKLRQTVRRMRRDKPDCVIAVTGCYPQAFPEQAQSFDADIIIGNKNKAAIVEAVNRFIIEKKRVYTIEKYLPRDCFEPMPSANVEGHTRAFLKIQDGCSSFCTYCIIPTARGQIRSMPLDNLISEAKALAENGYREIVLVGINLAFYGADTGHNLADAVEAAASINGVERVRLGSLEPERMTDNILDRLSECDKFCPSFHLSLQSGCDKTLRAMNRRYTSDEYYALVTRIRQRFPDCGITTDVMVGFPGETDTDHRESVEFVKKISFSDIHVFPYSRRPGTPADNMTGQISSEVKKIRAAQMSSAADVSRDNFLQTMIGRAFPVLFEREKSDGIHHGYTPNYTHVKILTKYSDKSLRNSIFYVKIERIDDGCCLGHICDAEPL